MAGIWESLYWQFTGKDWRVERMNREQELEHAEGQLERAVDDKVDTAIPENFTVWGAIKASLTICSVLFIFFLFFVTCALICRYFHFE